MSNMNLALILDTAQEYIRYSGDDEKKYAAHSNMLFTAISELYLPLLGVFESLEKDAIPFKMGLVLTPVLCTLLEDPLIQSQYINWIEQRILLGKSELEKNRDNAELASVIKCYLKKNEECKVRFQECNQRIVRKFHEYQKKGNLELLATCGTDIFFPHYSGMTEIMNAQVETGIYAFRYFLGSLPDGFWLPEMGYCAGVEKVLGSYGINYTVLDARSFLLSEEEPKNGIFTPVRFSNSLVAFCNDPKARKEIFGEGGYASNGIYREQNRDIGYELPLAEIADFVAENTPRYPLGYKYWNKFGNSRSKDCECKGSVVYNFDSASLQAKNDAADFIEKKFEKLNEVKSILPDAENITLVTSISSEDILSKWQEAVVWIENLFREAAKKRVIKFENCCNLISEPFKLQKIKPFYGSSSGMGYGENLISSKNNWMFRFVSKASKRMVDLAERFPSDTGLKARLLNLGAKELMLSQSSGWAKMIDNEEFSEYAAMRFTQSINDFTSVFDALGSNTVSTEWLTKLENSHQLFPWMNYRIFNKKR